MTDDETDGRTLGHRVIRPPASLPELRWRDLAGLGLRSSWRNLRNSHRLELSYNGRAAIYQYFRRLRSARPNANSRNVVLVPAFHCPTVIDPILHAGYEVRYFAVDTELAVVGDDFLSKLDDRVVAAIFIQYFGFDCVDARCVAACRESGVLVIEDCSHSFLSLNPLRLAGATADAAIYSFWKIVPSLVGGGALIRDAEEERWCKTVGPSLADSLERCRRFAAQLHEGALVQLGFSQPSARAEAPTPAVRNDASTAYPFESDKARWRMPLTARLVMSSVDLNDVALRRRRNYEAFSAELIRSSDCRPLRSVLDGSTCPWGYPVVLRDRPQRDYLIRARGVPLFTFGEVLHPTLARQRGESSLFEVAQFLSNSVLAFAIHQNFDVREVTGYATTVNEAIADF